MHLEGQEFLHDIDPLCMAIGLKTLVFEVEYALLADTPENECDRAGGLGQGPLPVLDVPLPVPLTFRGQPLVSTMYFVLSRSPWVSR